jgi:hypothetical protein
MSEDARYVLKAVYPDALVDELIKAYSEAKRNFYLGGHRLSAVAGGRFCEGAFRILQYQVSGKFTPLGRSLDTEKVISNLSSQSASDHPKSVRVYIPRALRVVYDIRNNRDAAHLADGIDSNLQDATLVVSVLDWVLAELIRVSKGATPEKSLALIESLVVRKVPSVQDFGDFQKVLRSDLRARERVLVLLYRKGGRWVAYAELYEWMPQSMRSNLRRTVRMLDQKALVHAENERLAITYTGEKAVESKGLLDPL